MSVYAPRCLPNQPPSFSNASPQLDLTRCLPLLLAVVLGQQQLHAPLLGKDERRDPIAERQHLPVSNLGGAVHARHRWHGPQPRVRLFQQHVRQSDWANLLWGFPSRLCNHKVQHVLCSGGYLFKVISDEQRQLECLAGCWTRHRFGGSRHDPELVCYGRLGPCTPQYPAGVKDPTSDVCLSLCTCVCTYDKDCIVRSI